MSDAALDRIGDFIDDHGYLSWLGLQVEQVEPERVVTRIPDRQTLQNVGQAEPPPIHGGVVATLADTTSAIALRTTFEDPASAKLTTTHLDVSYLRPATGDLRATGEVVRAGRSMGVADVEVTADGDDGRKAVAVGRTNYRLFRGEA